MLYIIGLGLNEKGISLEGAEIAKKCSKIYLENYTVDFCYKKEQVEKILGKKIEDADRNLVEGLSLVEEAKNKDLALLIYGAPLSATTHITLIEECKKEKVKCRVIYAGSVLDAVAETGLQLYKFGKIASMPNFEADSFMELVKANQSINAHSLILADIGLKFEKAIEKLENAAKKHKLKLDKVAVCERLGTDKSRIYYNKISELKNKDIQAPYCFIIPGKLHFMEEEVLEGF
jgi:diphthine synthase